MAEEQPDEEFSSLFPVFLLSVVSLCAIPWTLYRLSNYWGSGAAKKRQCLCSECINAPKNQVTVTARLFRFMDGQNVTLLCLWAIMGFLYYYVQATTRESAPFEPFSILGLPTDASDSQIKKAYYKLSRQYHPDKNPDPAAHKYFVDYISKAYQALTDEVARENFKKYGHPDGRQAMKIGIALPDLPKGASASFVLLGLVGGGVVLPLLISVLYLSRSAKYTGNFVMNQTLYNYYHLIKPSLAPSKVLDVFLKAQEFFEMPVRRTDEEPLQRLFTVVRSELNLDPKNLKQETAKFWKRHPALVKAELLMLAQLARESAAIPASLQADFVHLLKLSPRLLDELMKMALVPRTAQGQGWLRPALGVMELSQSFVQAVPLSARKVSDRSGAPPEGVGAFLQLPHFDETLVKKLGRKNVRTLPELREMDASERLELITSGAGGLSYEQAADVEAVLSAMPQLSLDVVLETEGEAGGVLEGDLVTLRAWVKLERGSGMVVQQPHSPHYPFIKEEVFWVLLADSSLNTVWASQKVVFGDESAAVSTAANSTRESLEGQGAEPEEVNRAVREAIAKVRDGFRLVLVKFIAGQEGTFALTAFCLSDTWIGCDKRASLKLKIGKRSRAGGRISGLVPGSSSHATTGDDGSEDEGGAAGAAAQQEPDEDDEDDEDEDYDQDYESEYSEDEDDELDKQKKVDNAKKSKKGPELLEGGSRGDGELEDWSDHKKVKSTNKKGGALTQEANGKADGTATDDYDSEIDDE